MALDRQSIEKKDFPVGRRGYDPDAVDAHLAALADEVSELKRSARKRSDTLASSASDQVRSIVEAAETSAADIQRGAEADAREIRDEASAEAKATREQATEQAREYIGSVSESTDSMLARLGSMQTELDVLIESLRTGAGRLSEELRSLQADLSDVRGVVSPRPDFEPESSSLANGSVDEAGAPLAYEDAGAYAEGELGEGELPSGEVGDAALSEGEMTPVADSYAFDGGSVEAGDGYAAGEEYAVEQEYAPAAEYATTEAPLAEGYAAAADGTGADAEGARLIALNMALDGTPREETARYLNENFALSDSDGLLDEVYASVEG